MKRYQVRKASDGALLFSGYGTIQDVLDAFIHAWAGWDSWAEFATAKPESARNYIITTGRSKKNLLGD